MSKLTLLQTARELEIDRESSALDLLGADLVNKELKKDPMMLKIFLDKYAQTPTEKEYQKHIYLRMLTLGLCLLTKHYKRVGRNLDKRLFYI